MKAKTRLRECNRNSGASPIAQSIRIGGTEYRDEGSTQSDYNAIVTAWILWCSLFREFATTKHPVRDAGERDTWLGRITALAASVPGDLTPVFTALDELADILCQFMVAYRQFKADVFRCYLRSWKPGCQPVALLKGAILSTSRDVDVDSGWLFLADCRTLAQWFKKLEVDRPDLDQKAEEDFVSFEAELTATLPRRVEDPEYLELTGRMNELLLAHNMGYRNILFNAGFRGPVQPRHGPGVVANPFCRCQLDKYLNMAIDSRVEYLLRKGCNYSVTDFNPYARESSTDEDRTNRFVSVPKNWKKKRAISAEPPGLQYFQQAIRNDLYRTIENDGWWGRRLRFSDQARSRALALEGSANGFWATIDMSSASDSVTSDIVSRTYKCTCLKLWLMATRSTSTRIGDAVIHDVKKFAPMGSATCFPVESMIFVLISELAIRDSMQGVHAYHPCCVYGDDIIVPVYAVHTLLQYLSVLGFTVNTEKSFVRGYFREACGAEGWNGYPVKPIKLKRVYSQNRIGDQAAVTFEDADRVVRLVNALQLAGFHATSRLLLTDFLHREVHVGRSKVEASNALVFTGESSDVASGMVYSASPTNFHLTARWVSGCSSTSDTSRLPLSRRTHGPNAYQVTEYRVLTWRKKPNKKTLKVLAKHSDKVENIRYLKWLVARTMEPLAEQRAKVRSMDSYGSGVFWLEPVTQGDFFREVDLGVTMVPTFTWSVSPDDLQFRHGRVQL